MGLRRAVEQFRLGSEGTLAAERSSADASRGGQAISSGLDFARVKMAHRSWRLKLRSFLDGHENIDGGKLASHRNCELGKWIYGGGMTAYSRLQEMQQLETKHKNMHVLVKHVVELKHAGKASEAEQEFSRVCEEAEGVVALITAVEAQVMGGRAHGAAGWQSRRAVQQVLN